jgi:hypothetical protein
VSASSLRSASTNASASWLRFSARCCAWPARARNASSSSRAAIASSSRSIDWHSRAQASSQAARSTSGTS